MAASRSSAEAAPRQPFAGLAATLIQRWQPLAQRGWDRQAAHEVSEALLDLVASNDSQPWPTLQTRALDLAAYLSSFVDDRLLPTSEQSKQLEALFSALGSALSVAAEAAATAQAPRADGDEPARSTTDASLPQQVSNRRHAPREVALVGLASEQAPGLAQALREQGYQPVEFASSALLGEYLELSQPCAAIVHAAQLGTLARLLPRLRGESQIGAPKPVLIVLSPNGDLSHRLLAMRCGAQDLLRMPVDGLRVSARLQALQEQAQAPPCRVLLVEPDTAQADECRGWLEREGMLVRAMPSARDALDALACFQPDVILVDIELPDLGAIEFTALVRQQTEARRAAILLLATPRSAGLRFDAIAAGGDEVLLKPLRPRHLLGSIRARVQRARLLGPRPAPEGDADPLTRLYPRSRLVERCSQWLGDASVGLIFIALDDAESLRTRIGLGGLPRVDAQIGPRLAAELAEGDLACSYQDLSWMVLARRNAHEAIVELAERLRLAVAAAPLDLDGRPLAVTASIGACLLVDDEGEIPSVDRVVRKVQAVRLAAAHLGGNRTLWYRHEDAGLRPIAREESMRALFSRPSSEQAHTLAYAPLVPLAGRLSGQYSVRFRIHGPEGSGRAFEYSEFAPLAAESGQVFKLDCWLLSRALDARAEALRHGHQVRLFLPVSLASLTRGDFHALLAGELRERRLSGAGLTLEFDCAEALADLDGFTDAVTRLRRLGVRIGLRETDADQPPAERLPRLGVDFMRLKSCIVGALWQRADARHALARLVRSAHKHGVAVIADSIDGSGQARLLEGLGVDYGEGPGLASESAQPRFDFRGFSLRPAEAPV